MARLGARISGFLKLAARQRPSTTVLVSVEADPAQPKRRFVHATLQRGKSRTGLERGPRHLFIDSIVLESWTFQFGDGSPLLVRPRDDGGDMTVASHLYRPGRFTIEVTARVSGREATILSIPLVAAVGGVTPVEVFLRTSTTVAVE